MRNYIIVLALAFVALAQVHAKLHPFVYPKDRCCAKAHSCPKIPFKPPTCKAVLRPFCPKWWPIYRACRQNVLMLDAVYYKPFWPKGSKTMCCTVMNCPRIQYSDCSYKPERCTRIQSICTPKRYRLRLLQLRCPNNKGYKVYRYFPDCCRCTKCRGDLLFFKG